MCHGDTSALDPNSVSTVGHSVHSVTTAREKMTVERGKGDGAENLSVLRRLARYLLRQESTATCGTKNERLKIARDEHYILNVLSGA